MKAKHPASRYERLKINEKIKKFKRTKGKSGSVRHQAEAKTAEELSDELRAIQVDTANYR